MLITENIKLALTTIDFPVYYEASGQTIRDAKGMMVCDVRGWSKIQFMDKAQKRHDAIGDFICYLLNKYKEEETFDLNKKILEV